MLVSFNPHNSTKKLLFLPVLWAVEKTNKQTKKHGFGGCKEYKVKWSVELR